jgi:hypothetical protein
MLDPSTMRALPGFRNLKNEPIGRRQVAEGHRRNSTSANSVSGARIVCEVVDPRRAAALS